ncbi:MAG: type I methionyl aminopeptidase [Erysipelotrichaceae bacterium]|nr:type I methionyl aminopeptidase [Erysipelotrichaceae bacterium]
MITIKSEKEIELMRHAGYLVSLTHQYLKPFIKPGITTKELDELAEEFIRAHDGVPTCKGYEGFPASLCTSINDEVVHGIPSNRKLKNGDIITIDMVIGYHGYQGDAAWTYAVGTVNEQKKYLMEHTEKSLYEGIKMVKSGAHIGDISHAIEEYATNHHLGVVKELVGHGIGTEMHESPDVPNYGHPGTGPRLKEGMIICIEPMLNLGSRYVGILDDNWTIVTEDGKPSAHYEHTVLVTKDGYEILTPRLD